MILDRPIRPRATISLVPMIDVLMILLVFFMVTSTYLDLDMIPATPPAADPGADTDQAARDPTDQAADLAAVSNGSMLLRLGGDGVVYLRGQPQTRADLAAVLSAHAAQYRAARVAILPSPRAAAQSLVTLIDTVAAAGIADLQVIRIEAGP